MASVDDYTSGRIHEQAAQALVFLMSADNSLVGSEQGERLLAHIRSFQPRLIDMAEAEQRIQDARRCAVGPRICFQNTAQSDYTEAVFLDELAEGMAAAGKAEMVGKAQAIAALEQYKKHPLVLSTVSGKPMELCRSSRQTCICWNMEKRGLMCLEKKKPCS